MAQLLLEIRSEEIPARMQAQAAEDLQRLVVGGLTAAGLPHATAEAFYTPRRLTLVVDGLPVAQPDTSEEKRGPRADAPAPAVDGFLKSVGLPRDKVEVRETPKGTFFFATVHRRGRPAIDVVAETVAAALPALPWPKSMRWADLDVRWVRPLQGIVCLFEGAIVPLTFGPVTSGAVTTGHRFLAPAPITVTDAAGYRAQMKAARVILDAADRKALILAGAQELASRHGYALRPDDGLLDEVAGLVEWPVVYAGRIDARFMDVPAEVLITAMRSHQKYFSLLEADGRLAPLFIVVANTETTDGGAAVIAGNERVLRARLSDAKFFWDQDRRKPLASRIERLAERVFHAKLGSDLARTDRLVCLAASLAGPCGGDPADAERAAGLVKADLTTGMVGEFPELQGVMGRYYALHDGEPPSVANAIADHYAPKGPSDGCPSAPVAMAVALADKIDTLAGFFLIDEKPTGTRDPFALRRAALGVIRIIIENNLRLALRPLLDASVELYRPIVAGGDTGATAAAVLEFIADRLKVHLKGEGLRHDLISAVFAGGGEDDLVRLLARVRALADFLATDDGANLLTAYRRASNIVRIEEKRDGLAYEGEAERALLTQGEEIALFAALGDAQREIAAAVEAERFAEAMAALAKLRLPVDAFFEHVTVNCPDPPLRINRLHLLSQIRSSLEGVADFSHMEG